MTIKVLEKTEGCLPKVISQGDWIDLYTAEEVTFKSPFAKTLRYKTKEDVLERTRDVVYDSTLIPLGVAMELPKGFEAIIVPRSSTFKKWGLLQTNSMGIIDETYNGDDDEWKLPVIATRNVTIPKGTRLCQFRVQLSQKASFWQKLEWLLRGNVKIKKVSHLDNAARGGFGSTGSN